MLNGDIFFDLFLSKFLLLPYTCDGIKDAALTASTKILFLGTFCARTSLECEERTDHTVHTPTYLCSSLVLPRKEHRRMDGVLDCSLVENDQD